MSEHRYWRRSDKPRKQSTSDQRTDTERDRGRIGYSSYLRRLAGVTQVVTPSLEAPRLHTRESHSHKVGLIAREIAEHICRLAATDKNGGPASVVAAYGGLDIPAAEAAGLAHDLGHPPFGHGGEVALNQLLRKNGVIDGFEGNAQTFRIVSRLDPLKVSSLHGLDLTRVTLAAIMKYPRKCPADRLVGGLNEKKALRKPPKFGSYEADGDAFDAVILMSPTGASDAAGAVPLRQTLEAAIMDLADDVAYATHDLEDFYKERLIDFAAVKRDFEAVEQSREAWTKEDWTDNEPNYFLRIAKDLEETYEGYFDRREYADAISYVDTLIFKTYPLSFEFDGSTNVSARVGELVSTLMKDVFSSIETVKEPKWKNGPSVVLKEQAWHRIQVLKTITRRYVVGTRRMGIVERSQTFIVTSLFNSVKSWLETGPDLDQLPEPLGSFLRDSEPLSDKLNPDHFRAIADYLCTLSDSECLARSRWLAGGEVPSIALAR